MYYARTFKRKLHNPIIHVRTLTSVLQESQGLTMNAFVMLLLAMIFLQFDGYHGGLFLLISYPHS